MPKEKKSACSAIRLATKHARGSSIIVPDRVVLAHLEPLLVADPDDELAHDLELLLVVDERDHDLERAARSPSRSTTAAAARMIASTCIS